MEDDEFLALNAVYLRKIASTQVIEECTGLAGAEVGPLVARLLEQGRLVDVGGMVMLEDEGTATVLGEYRHRYAGLRGDDQLESWYQRFEILNQQFLTTISAWQTDAAPETHLGRLIRLVERQVKALTSVSGTIPRYRRYAERFTTALDRVDTGDTGYVTDPTRDSIHNIWFEFHEDILTVLGRPRDVAEAGQA